MKKWFLHILLFASLFGMLTTSCSQDEEIADIPSAGTPSEKVTIRFTLDLGEQGGMRSRSSWEGYDEDDKSDSDQAEPGIGDENFIDTNRLQVFMFKTNGTYIGGLKDMEAERQGDSNIYNIKGEVDVDKSAIVNEVLNCKIMVVANANAATVNNGQVTGYNNDAIFNHNVTSIPMWGIGTYTINLLQQLQVDLDEPIYMLRSMAKIEVTLSGTLFENDYRLKGATLSNYNTIGYVVPSLPQTTGTSPTIDWNALTKTTALSTWTDAVARANTSAPNSTDTSIGFTQVTEGKSYVIYVPEYENDGSLSISLNLVKGDTESPVYKEGETPYTILLNNYVQNETTGKYEPNLNAPLDLVRNHWYKYTINSINDGMNVTLAVAPWEVKEDVLDYTQHTASISVSSITGTTLGWEEGTYINDEDNILLNGGNTAIFKVKINTPTNAEWKAVLEDPNDIFEFDTSEGFSGSPQGNKNIYGFNDVEGGVVTIGVKSKSSTVVGTYSAVLRMYVNVGTKWVQVDLVDANIGNKISVYTIKHSYSGH